MINIPPLDAATSLLEEDIKTGKLTGFASYYFRQWLTGLTLRLRQAAYLFTNPVDLTGQHASIGATAIPTLSVLPAGWYRVSWYLQITTAAVTSSSATVTIGWTRNSQALSLSGQALTGNTLTSVQTGSVLIRIDQGGPVTYSVAYASNGANEMNFALSLTLEAVG